MAKKHKNPFKELEASLHEAPPEMKQKVMNDIAAAKLIMDMASLFSINLGGCFAQTIQNHGKQLINLTEHYK